MKLLLLLFYIFCSFISVHKWPEQKKKKVSEEVAEVSREQHTEVLFTHAVSWQSERAQTKMEIWEDFRF